ncbi:MAG: hypothetical protein ACPHY8_06845 [Patescibacteria group bacterium]
MTDILKKYNKQKKFSNISIVATSLVFAVGINIFLFDDTNLVKNLKVNAIESEIQMNKSDLYLEQEAVYFSIFSSKNMTNVKNVTFSIVYNPENINILKANGLQHVSTNNGVSTFLLQFDEPKNIIKDEKVALLEINKNKNKTEHINIVEANFTDTSGNSYELSTS